MNAPRIEGRGLSYRVAGRELLAPLDLDARAGEVVGLLGPNGAGKSTAFGVLSGELEGASGRVLFDGADVSREPVWQRAKRGLGYLPQGTASLPGLTASEQLALLAELRGLRGVDVSRAVEESLRDVDLLERARTRVEKLSGGERRRLELAGVLLGSPPRLILDEPFAGVEPVWSQRLASLVRRAASRGAAVLLSDHARETLSSCDRALVLVRGTLLASGPARDVAQNAEVRAAYFGV